MADAGPTEGTRRAVVLVDGEHHPPVLRTAIAELTASGIDVAEAVVLGGGEKLAAPGVPPDLGVPAQWPAEAEHELVHVLDRVRPDLVLDLSGEPVVDAPRRLRLAAVVLSRGVAYESAGSRYDPPPLPALSRRATLAVIATGKRVGKTAMSGALVRHAMARGREPVVVAMGRGGPPDPVVVPAGSPLDVDRLLEIVRSGAHAASDFYEDAVMTGASTVGCYRVGDGAAGEVAVSNVAAGVARANDLGGDLTVLEGSGAALPPCHADASVLVVPATSSRADIVSALPLRFVLADLVLVTFAGPPTPPSQAAAVKSVVCEMLARLPRADGSDAEPEVVLTRFRPHPLEDVSGARVFFVTTAPEPVAEVQAADLERHYGAQVVGTSAHLSNRPALLEDLGRAQPHEVVVTELKAAAVDVVVQAARESGVHPVFCDNRPVRVAPGDDPDAAGGPLEDVFDDVIERADERFAVRSRSRSSPPAGA